MTKNDKKIFCKIKSCIMFSHYSGKLRLKEVYHATEGELWTREGLGYLIWVNIMIVKDIAVDACI